MNEELKTKLQLLADEWLQIAGKCDAVAQRHKAKGEILCYHEQLAFGTARRACAQDLKRIMEGGATAAGV